MADEELVRVEKVVGRELGMPVLPAVPTAVVAPPGVTPPPPSPPKTYMIGTGELVTEEVAKKYLIEVQKESELKKAVESGSPEQIEKSQQEYASAIAARLSTQRATEYPGVPKEALEKYEKSISWIIRYEADPARAQKLMEEAEMTLYRGYYEAVKSQAVKEAMAKPPEAWVAVHEAIPIPGIREVAAGFVRVFEPVGRALGEAIVGKKVETRPAEIIIGEEKIKLVPETTPLMLAGEIAGTYVGFRAAGFAAGHVIKAAAKPVAAASSAVPASVSKAVAALGKPVLVTTAAATAVYSAAMAGYTAAKEGEPPWVAAGRAIEVAAGFAGFAKGIEKALFPPTPPGKVAAIDLQKEMASQITGISMQADEMRASGMRFAGIIRAERPSLLGAIRRGRIIAVPKEEAVPWRWIQRAQFERGARVEFPARGIALEKRLVMGISEEAIKPSRVWSKLITALEAPAEEDILRLEQTRIALLVGKSKEASRGVSLVKLPTVEMKIEAPPAVVRMLQYEAGMVKAKNVITAVARSNVVALSKAEGGVSTAIASAKNSATEALKTKMITIPTQIPRYVAVEVPKVAPVISIPPVSVGVTTKISPAVKVTQQVKYLEKAVPKITAQEREKVIGTVTPAHQTEAAGVRVSPISVVVPHIAAHTASVVQATTKTMAKVGQQTRQLMRAPTPIRAKPITTITMPPYLPSIVNNLSRAIKMAEKRNFNAEKMMRKWPIGSIKEIKRVEKIMEKMLWREKKKWRK